MDSLSNFVICIRYINSLMTQHMNSMLKFTNEMNGKRKKKINDMWIYLMCKMITGICIWNVCIIYCCMCWNKQTLSLMSVFNFMKEWRNEFDWRVSLLPFLCFVFLVIVITFFFNASLVLGLPHIYRGVRLGGWSSFKTNHRKWPRQPHFWHSTCENNE